MADKWSGEERRKSPCEIHSKYLEDQFDKITKEFLEVRGEISAYRYRMEEVIKEDVIPVREKVFTNGLSKLPEKIDQMALAQKKRDRWIMGMVAMFLLAFIGGVWRLSGRLAAVETTTRHVETEVVEVKGTLKEHVEWGIAMQASNESRLPKEEG